MAKTRVLHFQLARLLRLLVTVSVAPLWAEITMLHDRGSFQDPFMYVPVASLPIAFSGMLASDIKRDECRSRSLFRPFAAWLAFLGIAGSLFHLIGIRRQMGGFYDWKFNVVTGPPFPAPPQVGLLGLIGLAASAPPSKGENQRLAKWIDAVNSAGYLLLATEAGYNHWKGNFFNPIMFVPLVLGPTGSLAHISSTLRPQNMRKPILPLSILASLVGLAGFGFHLWNISKRPGKWSLHNFFYGAPAAAPLQMTAYGLMGLLAAIYRSRK